MPPGDASVIEGAVEPAVGAVAPDQFGMGAALDDASALEHDDAVGVDHA